MIIGGFLVAAALRYDAREALGLGGSLRVLQQQPYGWCSPSRQRVSSHSAPINSSRRPTGASRRLRWASSGGSRQGFRRRRALTNLPRQPSAPAADPRPLRFARLSLRPRQLLFFGRAVSSCSLFIELWAKVGDGMKG
ncbi:MAG: DUF1206 domain-containing protein [Microvirga sp.]